MLDLKFVRENKEAIEDTIRRQKKDALLDTLNELLVLDEEWRNNKQLVDSLRAERNKLSESINKAKKAGEDIKPLIEKAKELPTKVKKAEEEFTKIDEVVKSLLRKIPNVMHEGVPYGKDDSENVEVFSWGDKREPGFKVKNHVELCEDLGIADFEASANTSGNGFYFLKGDLALLNQALLNYATNKLVSKGYTYVEPPFMVRRHVLEAAMDAQGFQETIYTVGDEKDNLCLIGTAEHPILGMHENTVFQEDELPKKYVGYSMCFRQEIGSHGINEKGLWRTHQFNKIEQFVFCLPEQAWDLYDELLENSKEILQELELPYRVIEICTGDLALWKVRSYDLEVWRPTTQSYGEVMSLSNCGVYQANDLGIRFVRKNTERGVVHTLNNTAVATSRVLVAILEQYQNEDGTVNVPKVLQPYMGGKTIIKK